MDTPTLISRSGRLLAALAGVFLGVWLGSACRSTPEMPPEAPKPAPAPRIEAPRPPAIPIPAVPQPAQAPASVTLPQVITPVTVSEVMAFIKDHEGYSGIAYDDSRGNETIGYGFNLDAPGARSLAAGLGIDLSNGRISRSEAKRLFRAKTEEALDGARRLFDDFDTRPRDVQLAIADMIYNLGVTGFKKLYGTYRALKDEDYVAAAGRMRRIAWSRQVGGRAEKLADMVEQAAYAFAAQ